MNNNFIDLIVKWVAVVRLSNSDKTSLYVVDDRNLHMLCPIDTLFCYFI